MTNLTRYILPALHPLLSSMSLTTLAATELRALFVRYYEPRCCEPEHFAPVIATGIETFLTND